MPVERVRKYDTHDLGILTIHGQPQIPRETLSYTKAMDILLGELRFGPSNARYPFP